VNGPALAGCDAGPARPLLAVCRPKPSDDARARPYLDVEAIQQHGYLIGIAFKLLSRGLRSCRRQLCALPLSRSAG
jgi:hypothetical protein